MNLVVDSNVLFTYFWHESVARKLFYHPKLKLISPEFSLEEIDKYKNEIIKKTNISNEKFNHLLKELRSLIEFLPLEKYTEQLKEAVKICPDKDDVDFFAESIKHSCPIWSNDTVLKKQNKIDALNTEEIIELLF